MPVSRFYSSTAGKMVLQLGITAVATALSVDSTVGLPGSTPFTLLVDAGSAAEEVVTVTQVSGNTLVVQRGQDGTSAQAHANGAIVRHALTARDLRESREHEAATVAHGLTSQLVGLNDPQALTNKNLAAASNVFPTTLATSTVVTAHTASTAAHGATGAVVGTTNVQTLTNKTLASPQFTGTVTAIGTVNVGDATSSSQYYYRVYKKAQTGANTYEALYYLDNSNDTSRLTHVLKQNTAEVARTSLGPDGAFATSGDVNAGGAVSATAGDVKVGDPADVAQRAHRTFKKSSTSTKTYERLDYLGDPADGTCAAVTVLKENNVEKARTTLYPDGSFTVNGNIASANISDTGWVSTGFVASSGWSMNGSAYRIVNGVVTAHIRVNRTGAAIASTATGNVADTAVCTIPAPARNGYTMSVTGVALASVGSGGFIGSLTNGVLSIYASTSPSSSWASGTDFYTTITYCL